MQSANVQLRLDTGDAASRLQRLALSSATMQESWSSLPVNVQLAHREMLRLTQVHTRLGYLRGEERRSVRLHADYIRQHQQATHAHAERLRQMTDVSNPNVQRYWAARTAGQHDLIEQDADLHQIHRAQHALHDVERQNRVMQQSMGFFQGSGLAGGFNAGEAASYYGRRALFGAQSDGTPNTPGQWLGGAVRRGVGGAWSTAKQLSGMFALFEGFNMFTKSMEHFEHKAEAVQEIGARIGSDFTGATIAIDAMHKKFRGALSDLKPGMMEMTRLLGADAINIHSKGPLSGGLNFALGTGLHKSQALSQYAHLGMYGRLDNDLIERALRASGMRSRPESYLGMLGAAQQGLGMGFFDVPSDAAARYTTMVGNAFGDAYRGPRGEQFMGRLIGGMRTPGDNIVYNLKLQALRGLPEFDLGNGVKAGGTSLWGTEKAIDSAHPMVLERYVRQIKAMHGTGHLAYAEMMRYLPGIERHEAEGLFKAFERSGGRMPTAAEIRRIAPNLDKDRDAVKGTQWYKQQDIQAGMEIDVYERLGEKLVPVANDIKVAAEKFLGGLMDGLSIVDALRRVVDTLVHNPTGGQLTTSVWDLQLAQMGSALGFGGSVAAVAALGSGQKVVRAVTEAEKGLADRVREQAKTGKTPLPRAGRH